jgi:MFS family permease
MREYRNILSVVMAVCLLQVASGILTVMTPLSLAAMQAGPLTIGAIAASYSAGFMLGALLAPGFLARVGHIRAFAACAGIGAAGTLVLYLAQHPLAWAAIRFSMGIVIAGLFTAAESWITGGVPKERRGAVVSFYQVLTKGALAFGPFLLSGSTPLGAEPFLWAGVAFALCAVPMAATHQTEPAAPATKPLSLRALTEIAPAAVFGVFLAGVANSGVLAFLPLFAAASAPTAPATAAAAVLAAAYGGSILSQWPAGKLSDKVDRRWVTAGLGAFAGFAALPLALLGPGLGIGPVTALAALWAAGSLSFYGILVAHAADRAEPGQIARVIAGLLFVWAGGSVVGPIVVSVFVRSALGLPGVFVHAGLCMVLLIGVMVWRARARERPVVRDRFHNATQNSLSGVEADPRATPRALADDMPAPAPNG